MCGSPSAHACIPSCCVLLLVLFAAAELLLLLFYYHDHSSDDINFLVLNFVRVCFFFFFARAHFVIGHWAAELARNK
jgi:hypothetical protein